MDGANSSWHFRISSRMRRLKASVARRRRMTEAPWLSLRFAQLLSWLSDWNLVSPQRGHHGDLHRPHYCPGDATACPNSRPIAVHSSACGCVICFGESPTARVLTKPRHTESAERADVGMAAIRTNRLNGVARRGRRL